MNNYVNINGDELLLLIKKTSKENEDLTLRQIRIIDSLKVSSLFEDNLILFVENENDEILLNSIMKNFFEPYINKIVGKKFFIFLKILPKNQKVTVEKTTKFINKNKKIIHNDASQLLKDFTLNNFIVSTSNSFVYQTCYQIAENPGLKKLNPFYLYGNPGLGKTHLLHAVGNYINILYPQKTILYTTAENFINDYIEAMKIKNNAPRIFRNKYENVDILLLDDIQFFTEDMDNTVKAFYNIFNQRITEKKQTIITADVKPDLLKNLHQRLISRFKGNIHWQIEKPDYELRFNFIQKYIKESSKNIEYDFSENNYLIEKIANVLTANIRELEGAINKILFYCEINKTKISEDIINSILSEYINFSETEITLEKIIECCAEYFNITINEIKSKSRTPQLTKARHISMYLARKLTSLTLIQIGTFYNKDHSSVINAEKKIKEQLINKTKIYDQINEITKKITKKI